MVFTEKRQGDGVILGSAVAPVLPILDLRLFRDPSTKAAFVESLRSALAGFGFFYLVGHNVGVPERRAAMQAAQQFFGLPVSAKREVDSALSPYVRGYSKLGSERTVGVVDVREVWEMGPDADPCAAAGEPAFMRLQGPNLWPAEPARFRPAITGLVASISDACDELMQGAALALDQPANAFDGYFADKNTATKFKCCNYPTTAQVAAVGPGNVEPASLGVGPHKDYGFLSVIDSDVAGLQVLSRRGEWFSVPVIDGAFIVNGGELLELASGGAFLAATHRVQATGADVGRPRLSLCFFHNPGFKAVVRPITKLPPRLATAAAANREVRSAAAAAGEGTDLYGEEPRPYGESALKGYLRSLPHIFKLHHPDLILAETATAQAKL